MNINYLNKIFSDIEKSRSQINDLLKQKKYFSQSEYEEMRVEAERIKQKYIKLNEEVNNEIKVINKQMLENQNDLYVGGLISIEKFANDVCVLLSQNTNIVWEIIVIAFSYKKRVNSLSGLTLVPTHANIIAVAKKGAFSKDLTKAIFDDKDWLNNNKAMFGFMEMINKGDIILLHIVEEENKTEKMLNLFESGFNGDFDKHLLRYELEYSEKNPAHKYPILYDYLDNYVYTQLSKGKK